MKKILSILSTTVFVAGMTFFTGCGSTQFKFEQNSPMALIAVNGNGSIYTIEEDGTVNTDTDAIISTAIDEKLLSGNPERLTAVDRLDYAADYLTSQLPELTGISLVDKNVILKAHNYSKPTNDILDMIGNQKCATGFSPNMYQIGRKKARLLMRETGAKSLISLELEARKYSDLTNFDIKTMVPVLVLRCYVYDSNGAKVIQEEITVTGSKGTDMDKLYYDKDEFVELYPELIETAINTLIMRYM